MLTCRSISAARWVNAREVLVSYFAWRHMAEDAEDLAQETLAAVWKRSDYEFEREEDFLPVCYGFAANILLAAYRRKGREADFPEDMEMLAPVVRGAGGLSEVETEICVDQIGRLAESELRPEDSSIIRQSLTLDRNAIAEELGLTDANHARVLIFRAVQKLKNIVDRKKAPL